MDSSLHGSTSGPTRVWDGHLRIRSVVQRRNETTSLRHMAGLLADGQESTPRDKTCLRKERSKTPSPAEGANSPRAPGPRKCAPPSGF